MVIVSEKDEKNKSGNIIVEGAFDFWSALKTETQESQDQSNDNICLLTREPLKQNYVTMPCEHKYNYIPICREISAIKNPKPGSQKYNHGYISNGVKLHRNQVFCPYCRTVYNKLLPKIPEQYLDFVPDKYVTSSTNYISSRSCKYVFRSGKRKGQCCGKKNAFDTKNGTYCSQHVSASKKSTVKLNKVPIVLSDEEKKISNKFKLSQLKQILKNSDLPVSGTKAVLITRGMKAGISFTLPDM
jgi:hypothetical protein